MATMISLIRRAQTVQVEFTIPGNVNTIQFPADFKMSSYNRRQTLQMKMIEAAHSGEVINKLELVSADQIRDFLFAYGFVITQASVDQFEGRAKYGEVSPTHMAVRFRLNRSGLLAGKLADRYLDNFASLLWGKHHSFYRAAAHCIYLCFDAKSALPASYDVGEPDEFGIATIREKKMVLA